MMKRQLSLSTRTLLFSFLCVCGVLAVAFVVLDVAIKANLREALKASLHRTQDQFDETERDYNRRNMQLIRILSADTGLKAAVGLMREEAVAAARETIADQLRAMSGSLDYDLLMVIDRDGKVAATAGTDLSDAEIDVTALRFDNPVLIRLGKTLYEVTTVPIDIGSENLGALAVGKTYRLESAGLGSTVLMERHTVVASTLAEPERESVERQLTASCGADADGCEFRSGAESYLVLKMARSNLGGNFDLLCLVPLNASMSGFTRGLRNAFTFAGVGAFAAALWLSILASRAVAKPLGDLSAHLRKSGETGALWDDFPQTSSTLEVNLLAGALNQAAAARREVEVDLQRAKEAAEAASSAKSEFIANISHELRTPLNGILGMTDLVLDTEPSPSTQRDLLIVKSSAEQLLSIINDILDFSMIETGTLELDPIEFEFLEVLRHTARPLQQRALEKGLTLNVELGSELPVTVIGDPFRLRQILGNLIDNAIKFTQKGSIRVGVEIDRRDPDLFHFAVEDTGIGIPREKLAIIFEAFSQADGSHTRQYGGPGLGLTVSSRLVQMMHGQIDVESQPGLGSRFHFTARLEAPRKPGAQANAGLVRHMSSLESSFE